MPCSRPLRSGARRAAAALVALLGVFAAAPGPAGAFETVACQLANGFDFPVGRPDAKGYHKARGFWPNGHLGEDWNGNKGGDNDLGDPIYATASGVVVLSEDVKLGWGNCIIIRHIYREPSGKIDMVDSLYGHLLERKVKAGERVERGQFIGRMGSNNGMYPAHLHFEIRKNLAIGMNRSKFARDYSNYYSPTPFIAAHRQLVTDSKRYDVPINTFAPHSKELNAEQIAFAKSRGTSASGPGGEGSKGSKSSGVVRKRDGTISIPMKTTRGTSATADSESSKGASSKVPKVGQGKKPAEEPPPSPAMVPPSEGKSDFWSRLKSKLNNGQVTDPAGKSP